VHVSLEEEGSVVGGEHKAVVPLFRSFLPLTMSDHISLLAVAVVPVVLADYSGLFPGLGGVALVVIATIYCSLRIALSKHRHKHPPALEVSRNGIAIPHSHTTGDIQHVIPAQNVAHIEFFKGAGRLKDTDVSVTITDNSGQEFKLSGLVISLLRVREVLEKYGYEYVRTASPGRHLPKLALLIGVAGLACMYFLFIRGVL